MQAGRNFCLFCFRGEITLLHCVWGDKPLGKAFRVSPKFFHNYSRSYDHREVEVSQASILGFLQDESHGFAVPREIHFLDFAVCAAAEDMPYIVSVFTQGEMCVTYNSLSLHISCSVPAGNFLVPEGTVPRLQSVLLFCEGEVQAGEGGIAGFQNCVRSNVPLSLDVHRGVRKSCLALFGIVVPLFSSRHGLDFPTARRLMDDCALLIVKLL
jgi:hypothetical protein